MRDYLESSGSSSFARLFDFYSGAVWGAKHAPLVLGWTNEQLAPSVDVLQPYLTDHRATGLRFAIASCAISLVLENKLTGQPVRYARGKEHYRIPARYRSEDRFYTWFYVTRAMDALHRAGLVEQDLGIWSPSGGGRQSVAWPTEKLLILLDSLVRVDDKRGVPTHAETIVLRDLEDKKDIDYDDTVETVALRAEVEALNDALQQLHLYEPGGPFPILLMRRIFNGDINRGGRNYCKGRSFQNIWAKDRLNLQLLIDGVMHPVVEIDYANLHAVMAYSDAGLPIPPGDQYEIDGFDRPVVKRAFNVLLNATERHKAVAALSEDLHTKDYELWQHSGLTTRLRSACFPYAEAVVSAIEDKHRPIAEFFGSDRGAAFMRRDSDMAVQVMLRMITITGRCPLPVHDSFLVADIDQEALAFVMQEVASEEGLPLCLKASSSPAHPVPVPASASLYGGNTL